MSDYQRGLYYYAIDTETWYVVEFVGYNGFFKKDEFAIPGNEMSFFEHDFVSISKDPISPPLGHEQRKGW